MGAVVIYNGESGILETTVEDPSIIDELYCRLKGKHRATFTNVYVAMGEAAADGAASFLKERFLPWLKSVGTANDRNLSDSLTRLMHEKFTNDPEVLANTFRDKIPWDPSHGYVNFHSVPKHSKKGHMHVSMLAFDPAAYSGAGMFLNVALVLLDTLGTASLTSKCIEVRPRSGRKLTACGWEPDGAIIMGTYAFIFSALACWSCLTDEKLPILLTKHVSGLPCSFTKHNTNETRLLANLADSAAQRMANRTVQDPLFLSLELSRCSFAPEHVKGVVRLYRQRVLANPALSIPHKNGRCCDEVDATRQGV